jgi:hypothetical protein
MAEGKKQPTAKDFAEQAKRIRDLEFIASQQAKKAAKRDADDAKLRGELKRDADDAKLRGELAEQKRTARHEGNVAFAEQLHTAGQLPGRARKKLVVDYLDTIGDKVTRVRDFAEGEEADDLERAKAFIQSIAPTAVDTSGRMVSASEASEEAVDFAELDGELADWRGYKKLAKEAGQPTDLAFHTFAEAQGHDAELVETFCREKKITHPNVKDGNADK